MMLDFQTFLPAVLIVSVFTGLTTEAVKKVLADNNVNYQANTLAGVIAVILSAVLGIGYMLYAGLAFSVQSVVYLLALIFVGWLCAMVGYDKVVQAISQFKTNKED